MLLPAMPQPQFPHMYTESLGRDGLRGSLGLGKPRRLCPEPPPASGSIGRRLQSCQDLVLPPPLVTVVDSEESIWFISTNSWREPRSIDWMGVHGSQGVCLSLPASSPVAAADNAGLALGEGHGADESTSRNQWGLAAGCGRPSGRVLVSDLCSTAADQSMAWGEGLLPHLVFSASTP